jgi:hypothetical protein
MNQEPSLISMHPFFQKFILTVVKTIKERDFPSSERFVIDADLIPRVSGNNMKIPISKPVMLPPVIERPEPRIIVARNMEELVAPIGRVESVRPNTNVVQVPPKAILPQRQVVMPQPSLKPVAPEPRPAPVFIPEREVQSAPVLVAPAMDEGPVDKEEAYGKISPLLNDPSISTIECLGADKELMIIRAGQKQRTRIVLSAGEIKGVLERVADDAHIPLIEGVFRASVPGFSINAVISDMIGNRFVIKKVTAYSMLE